MLSCSRSHIILFFYGTSVTQVCYAFVMINTCLSLTVLIVTHGYLSNFVADNNSIILGDFSISFCKACICYPCVNVDE